MTAPYPGADERYGEIVVDLALAGPMRDLFLLVDHPEGVWYSHQCGGHTCVHPMRKGFLVPVFGTRKVVRQLDRYFARALGPECCRGIADHNADMIDGIFARHERTRGMTVDRERLHLDKEAWLFIRIASDTSLFVGSWRLVYNFDLSVAPEIVLLWQNSD